MTEVWIYTCLAIVCVFGTIFSEDLIRTAEALVRAVRHAWRTR